MKLCVRLKVAAVFFVLFFYINSAFAISAAFDYKKVTDDYRIIAALEVLKNTESYDTLKRIFEKDKKGKYTQIIFYDLGMVSYGYKKHFAMASKDNFGENYIMINAKYRNSPKEALAALIAHESCHKLEQADFKEEFDATIVELKQWNKSLVLNPELKSIENDLIKRLNGLSELYKQNGEEAIKQKITGNSFYKAQFNI